MPAPCSISARPVAGSRARRTLIDEDRGRAEGVRHQGTQAAARRQAGGTESWAAVLREAERADRPAAGRGDPREEAWAGRWDLEGTAACQGRRDHQGELQDVLASRLGTVVWEV